MAATVEKQRADQEKLTRRRHVPYKDEFWDVNLQSWNAAEARLVAIRSRDDSGKFDEKKYADLFGFRLYLSIVDNDGRRVWGESDIERLNETDAMAMAGISHAIEQHCGVAISTTDAKKN